MIEKVKSKIREIKDFPKPGIGFKDIIPILQDPEAFNFIIGRMTDWVEDLNPDVIIGIESRGFLFAAPIADRLKIALSLIRKKGKLPYKTVSVRAPNEYAVEYFEIHTDGLVEGQKVVIVDDLIATGSSSIAALDLVGELMGEAVGFGAVVDLAFLNGIKAIQKSHPGVDILSLITFED